MRPVVNHTVLPFFDRVPIRARAAVRRACDRAESRDTADHQLMALTLDLRQAGIEPPTADEFRLWLEEVRLGRFTRASYEEGKLYGLSRQVERQRQQLAAELRERAALNQAEQQPENVEKPYITDATPMDCFVRDPVSGAVIRAVATVTICPETRQLLAAGLRALADDIERDVSHQELPPPRD